MATYSFLDVNCVLTGTGGSANLANSAGAAEEGIKITPIGEKNVMTVGADGSFMHSLLASTASKVEVSLLKTSPMNALLMAMYNVQTNVSSLHGKNVIALTILQTGEAVMLTGVAFNSIPDMEYAKEGKTVVWKFDCGKTTAVMGIY